MSEKKLPLSEQLEVIRDGVDSAPIDHVNYFLATCYQDLSLPEFSLLTKKEAGEAVAALNEKAEQLSKRLRTIQSLRAIVNQS